MALRSKIRRSTELLKDLKSKYAKARALTAQVLGRKVPHKVPVEICELIETVDEMKSIVDRLDSKE
jgi:hypothetical protein